MNHNLATPEFLLVGNAPYLNRGCEAIARGTVEILRQHFGAGSRFTIASYGRPEDIAAQRASETDAAISHVALTPKRWSIRRFCLVLGQRRQWQWAFDAAQHPCMPKRQFLAALQIGGDNYSLEYGLPERFMALDRMLQNAQIPVFLWGASVGPFESRPDFAPRMHSHLRTLDGIFARESETMGYLERNGAAARAYRVADPAFMMSPVTPNERRLGFPLPANVIGINLSSLLGRFAGCRDLHAWADRCAAVVSAISRLCDRDVLLIPHVASADPLNDDFVLLRMVRERASAQTARRILHIAAPLTAPEIKGVVASSCSVFAGARTHSTIAAISSSVPTLTFAYSRKGRAIPRDVFGSEDFSLAANEFQPDLVAMRVRNLLLNAVAVRQSLDRLAPSLRARASAAATTLNEILRASRSA